MNHIDGTKWIKINAGVIKAMTRTPVRCQEDLCAIVAKATVDCNGVSQSEGAIFGAAHGMAMGLFGKAFDDADEVQKWDWLDMCEAALRKEIGDPGRT